MTVVLSEDIERSLIHEVLAEAWEDIILDLPGKPFSPVKTPFWLSPRIVVLESPEQDDSGFRSFVGLRVTGVVKIEPEATVGLTIPRLADRVRAVVDSTRNAPGVDVKDEKGVNVARIEWREAQERRTYETDVQSRNVLVSGVDVVTIEALGELGEPCP